MGWVEFWDGDNSIYVNRAHLDAHYRRQLSDLAPPLPAAPFTLLDYGCGEALMAPALGPGAAASCWTPPAGARSRCRRSEFCDKWTPPPPRHRRA